MLLNSTVIKLKMLRKNSNLQLIYFNFIRLVAVDKGKRKSETVHEQVTLFGPETKRQRIFKSIRFQGNVALIFLPYFLQNESALSGH